MIVLELKSLEEELWNFGACSSRRDYELAGGHITKKSVA